MKSEGQKSSMYHQWMSQDCRTNGKVDDDRTAQSVNALYKQDVLYHTLL